MIWIPVAAFAVIFICILVYLDNRRIAHSHHVLATQGISRRIVHLSDIHSCSFTDKLLERVRKENPELIIVTGDLWDRSKLRVPEMIAFIRRLAEICDTVYSPGNHEFHEPEHEQIFRQIEKIGIHVLRHRIMDFRGVSVLGMDLLKYGAFNDAELKRLEHCSGFRIAAAHFPQFFEDIYSQYDIDLVLCGHAHGGQFRIPFLKIGLYSPGMGVFPKYSEGLHKLNGVKMIVSRGIGNSRFPFRLFNPPEMIVVDLRSKEA